VISLPVGDYSLLFRVFNGDLYFGNMALDNIAIVSCDYPPSQSNYPTLLSFSCDFDHSTMCEMRNVATSSKTASNFTLLAGDAVPNKNLGPTRDHTSNSTAGGFLYWNRQFPFTSADSGSVFTSTRMVPNFDMCVTFAYYVKSAALNKSGTTLTLSASGCMTYVLWSQSLDDSQGWQTATVRAIDYLCESTYYFAVHQTQSVSASVAFDDIEIDQCSARVPTTTTTTKTTKTTTTTDSSTKPSSSTSSSTTTINTLPSKASTSIPSKARQRPVFNQYRLITFCGFSMIFLNYVLC
jgi:hypothetical protein